MDIPNWSNAIAVVLGGSANRDNVARNDVPMVDASIPLLLMMPMAVPSSSMLMPRAAAGAPAYCMARPKSAMPNLEALAAAWTTSATWVVLAAMSPFFMFHIDRADVTTSDVVAMSSPDAIEASMMPGMAPMVCSASKPPAARRSMPSATSRAVVGNLAPIWAAASFIFCISSAVAPALTPAPVMTESKSMKVLTPIAPAPAMPAANGIILLARLPTPLPMLFRFRPMPWLALDVCSISLRIFRSPSVTLSVNLMTTSMISAMVSALPSSCLQFLSSFVFLLRFL